MSLVVRAARRLLARTALDEQLLARQAADALLHGFARGLLLRDGLLRDAAPPAMSLVVRAAGCPLAQTAVGD